MQFIHKVLKNEVMRKAYVAWFAIALFFFYQYILRVTPGVFVDELRLAFKITAEEFATFGALYLIGYSFLQIPMGILIDRHGVKKIALYSISICILGSLLFGLTEHFWVAQVSRLIIGIGSAPAFMCALKYIADHFTPGTRGFLMGATLALGTIGAVYSGKSLKLIDANTNWKDILAISAGIGAFVYLFIYFVVKDENKDPYAELNRKSYKQMFLDIFKIMQNRNIVVYSILAIGLYTPLAAMADLWGTAFLKQKYGISNELAAETTMLMYIGLTIGSLTLPWIAEKHNKLNLAIFFSGILILLTFSILIYGPVIDISNLRILLLLLGFFCGAEMMCFTGALYYSSKSDSGEIIGVVNTFNMLGGAILQQLIGWLLDKQWQGEFDVNGIRAYSADQFEVALTSLTVVILICCIISLSLLGKKIKIYKEI